MNPADKRLSELIDKWLTSLELHLKYSALDEASYWKVQPWVKHDRPSRWIIELAKQKALQLKEQLDSRAAMGDAKFSDALELMAFLTNLVGSQHIERFIPLAEPQNEVDLHAVSQTQAMPVAPAPAPAAAPTSEESTRESALITQPREAMPAPADATREMPRPPAVDPVPAPRPAPTTGTTSTVNIAARESARHSNTPRSEPRKTARREGKHAHHGSTTRTRISPEKEKTVVADAVRLLGWGREWHELPDLISRMADRPPTSEIRRILRDNKSKIEKQSSRA